MLYLYHLCDSFVQLKGVPGQWSTGSVQCQQVNDVFICGVWHLLGGPMRAELLSLGKS